MVNAISSATRRQIMPEIEPTEIEEEKTTERTKESEIKANVEFWQGLGIEVDEEDVRREIEAIPEVERFDWYIYMPEGISSQNIYELSPNFAFNMGGGWTNRTAISPEHHSGMDNMKFGTRSRNEKAYAIACQHKQEVSTSNWGSNMQSFVSELSTKFLQHIEGKNIHSYYFRGIAENLASEMMNKQCMATEERMVAEIRWKQEHNSSMDENSATICPKLAMPRRVGESDRLRNLYISSVVWDRKKPEERLTMIAPSTFYVGAKDMFNVSYDGIELNKESPRVAEVFYRPVITKDTPKEVFEKYHQESEHPQ